THPDIGNKQFLNSSLLSLGTPEAVAGYRQARRAAAAAVSEAKQRVWEKFGEAMEKDFRSAPKCFWKTVRHLRTVLVVSVSNIKSLK
ncbi:hypothetical protein DPEC_G00240360, partial [Dallia pectoralis]